MPEQNQPDAAGAAELERQLKECENSVGALKQENAKLTTALPDNKVFYDAARMAYAEYGNQIRHFSTIRSTLTVFLVTAGMTAFAGWLDKKYVFLLLAGMVFGASAIAVCLWFSFQTEKHVIFYKDVWRLLNGQESKVTLKNLTYPKKWGSIYWRMLWDPMNWLLILAALAFLCFAHRSYLHAEAESGRSTTIQEK